MNYTVKKLLGILLFSVIALSGCAFTTAKLDLGYLPTSESPLATIKPMNFALEIKDQRNIDERDRVGDKKNSYGMVTAKVLSNKDVTTILYEALENELKNNGHKVIDTKETSDAVINLDLKRYWSDCRIHFWDLEMIGTVSSHITILNPRNESVLFSKTMNSTFRESRQLALDEAFKRVLDNALAEFIRGFSRDPGLLKALQLAQQ